jgi:hypothetical protein
MATLTTARSRQTSLLDPEPPPPGGFKRPHHPGRPRPPRPRFRPRAAQTAPRPAHVEDRVGTSGRA